MLIGIVLSTSQQWWWHFLNCTINPFIYLAKYQDFQIALKSFCGCRKSADARDTELSSASASASASQGPSTIGENVKEMENKRIWKCRLQWNLLLVTTALVYILPDERLALYSFCQRLFYFYNEVKSAIESDLILGLERPTLCCSNFFSNRSGCKFYFHNIVDSFTTAIRFRVPAATRASLVGLLFTIHSWHLVIFLWYFHPPLEVHEIVSDWLSLSHKTALVRRYPGVHKTRVWLYHFYHQVGARLCFYTCLWFWSRGEGWWCYPSMHCRWSPSLPCSRSPGRRVVSQHALQVSRPTPKGKLRGLAWGSPGPHQGDACLGGCLLWRGEVWRPPVTATAVGGTHPTEIHSCWWMFFCKQSWVYSWVFRTKYSSCRI